MERPASPEPPASREVVTAKVSRLAREPDPETRAPAISQAIEQISEIVESLKRILDQMEEVLELTELAERQKNLDEREIDSLRRALRQLQRPRGAHPREDEHREPRPEEGPR
jgi:flagellar biosynthesis/type III secretory pathway chaperone